MKLIFHIDITNFGDLLTILVRFSVISRCGPEVLHPPQVICIARYLTRVRKFC